MDQASFLLKDKGEFYMVHRPERLTEIIIKMRKYKIEPKIIRFVFPKENKNSNLILVKGIKNAKEFLSIEEPLIIYNDDNTYTQKLLDIYGK